MKTRKKGYDVLLSMTGFGEAQRQMAGILVRAEIRSVNNRHLKLSTRLPEGYGPLEAPIEALVRQHVRRGSLQLNLQLIREAGDDEYRLNEALLVSYHRQLSGLSSRLHDNGDVTLASLLTLPGVVTEGDGRRVDVEAEWPRVEPVIGEALQHLNRMREREGAALAADLHDNCQSILADLAQIEVRAPEMVRGYEVRLLERINQLLADQNVQLDPTAIIREVGIFADRVDIREETVRLRSHLQQFDVIMSTEQSAGRKLEFLIQELLRETNTIGSKANDSQVARHVVQIKTAIERLREMLQNVE